MRKSFFHILITWNLIIFLLLTGCIYYGDMHDHSKMLDKSVFVKPNIYNVPKKNIKPKNKAKNSKERWWTKFNDPQLNHLVDIALADSPDMKIAESRVRLARALAQGAASKRWPTIDFTGSLQEQHYSTYGLIPPPFNGNNYAYGDLGFNFNYEFDFWGKYKEAFLARVSETEAAIADHAQAELILVSGIANQYFELLGIIEEIKLLKESIECQKQVVVIAKVRADHGVTSNIPLDNTTEYLQSLYLIHEQVKEQEKIIRHQLAALMGKNALKTTIKTTPFSYKSHYVKIPKYLPANLLAQRPDIRSAKAHVEANAHLVKVSKARFFPNINMNAFWALQSVFLYKLFTAPSQDYGVGGAIDLPIFDAGRRRADLAAKYAEYDISVNIYNQTILTALREVSDQVATLDTIKNQLNIQEHALHVSTKKYALYKDNYEHGIIAYTPKLEIEQLFIAQKIALIFLQMQQLRATVAMFKALGGGEKPS